MIENNSVILIFTRNFRRKFRLISFKIIPVNQIYS
jgi:hypothetical protein